MKAKLLSVALFLFLIMGIGGCEENENYPVYENIPLEYIKCPCGQETRFIKKVDFEDILLFDATRTPFDEMKQLSFNGERSLFISYIPENNNSAIYSIYTTMMGVGYICNLPNKVKEWEIPFAGQHVSLSADEFEVCELGGSIAANTYSDMVLTSFKRKIK